MLLVILAVIFRETKLWQAAAKRDFKRLKILLVILAFIRLTFLIVNFISIFLNCEFLPYLTLNDTVQFYQIAKRTHRILSMLRRPDVDVSLYNVVQYM